MQWQRQLYRLQPLLLLLLLLVGLARARGAGEAAFTGWRGEVPRPAAPGGDVVTLSWQPRIFLSKGLLSPAECEFLITNAQPRLERSGVSDAATGKDAVSDIRTSSGMFFSRGENSVIRAIEDRLAQLTMVAVENGEGIQVLRYEKDQKYSPHHDYFSFEGADDNGGNRLVTILMYLTDVEEGGETVFPKVPVPANQSRASGYSECAMKGLAYKPRRGDAVVFWSIRPDGRFDPGSLHGSCPVIRGVKWSATKWVHVGPFAANGEAPRRVTRVVYAPPPPPAVPGCINKNPLCNAWAEEGECDNNPGFMLEGCRAACARCDLGPNE